MEPKCVSCDRPYSDVDLAEGQSMGFEFHLSERMCIRALGRAMRELEDGLDDAERVIERLKNA